MSIASITLITAFRAALIAFFAASLALRCMGPLRSSRSIFWLMLLSLLMPSMLIGYHLATTRAAAVGWSAELVYSALVFIRFAPLAMVLACLRAPGTSAAGIHGFTLMNRASRFARLRFRVREWLGELAGIFCVMFVVTFQEFELAACMNARSWTIALFDAQAGGLALGESLRLMLWPLAVQSSALIVLVVLNRKSTVRESREPASGTSHLFPMAVVISLVAFPVIGPLTAIAKGFAGFASQRNFVLSREVGNSFLLALTSAIAVWMLAGWALKSRLRTVLFALPGLFGGLLVSLSLLALFQFSPLHHLRSSPVPVVVALILGLAPAALFVRHILDSGIGSEAVHSARLMGNRSVLWTQVKRPALWGGALLFLQAYGDFTANSLLAPPLLTSAFSRIFNLMHYGQSAALSAMLVVTLTVPLAALCLVVVVARIHSTRREN